MALRRDFSIFVVALALVVALFLAVPGLATNAHELSGSYIVFGKTEVGSHVRVQMRIRLVNHSLDRISVLKITFHSFLPPSKPQGAAVSMALEPHRAGQLTQELNITRQEYELWRKGAHPRLALEIQRSDGTRRTDAIELYGSMVGEEK
jgi:hypothetical protein